MRLAFAVSIFAASMFTATVAVTGWVGAQTVTVKPPVVRSVEFKDFHGVSAAEIVTRLNDRDIQLVERPYNVQNLQTAQGVVEELLAEKGQAGAQVKQTVTKIPPNSVKVTFTPAN
jgi:outer membrane protein assembly factor BamA